MSSVTNDEPDPEGSRLDESRRERGKGRRGLSWRRRDNDPPEVAELAPDDVEELLRRSHTAAGAQPATDQREDSPATLNDLRAADQSHDDTDDTAPATQGNRRSRGELLEGDGEIAALVGHRNAEAADEPEPGPKPGPEPGAKTEHEVESDAEASAEGEPGDEVESGLESGAQIGDADHIEATSTDQAAETNDPARLESGDEVAGQRVIAAAVDGGFAEPYPAPAPRGLARLRRRTGPASAARPDAKPLPESLEPPMLEEPIPDIDRPHETPLRPAEVLAHARAEIEAELAPAETTADGEPPANAEVVAALAARLRRDAELAAAQQAAERFAAEEAAQLASQARAEADRLAHEQADAATQAHRARTEAEQLALTEASAREAAERAARERAQAADGLAAKREAAELHAVEQAERAAAAHSEREAAEARAREQADLAATAAQARRTAEADARSYAAAAQQAHEERVIAEERARIMAEAAAVSAAEHAEFARRILAEREATERTSAEIAEARALAEDAARQQA
ncbi:MAG: hypothetical protein L0H31_12965, partial [Nocardioidaceae bacterium]|nr:hypothetical protein [Nocardioidaceae bacterium]